jgi:3-deoxy-7-phosphoheptulonate synthase
MNTKSKSIKIPSSDEIIASHPLSKQGYAQVEKDRNEIKDILAGKDERLILIVGPCSAWPSQAVVDYGEKLRALKDEVEKDIKLVMRVYIQKPRTTKGWTGPVNQPDPFKPADIAAGAMYARSLMVKLIEMGLPIADEAVFTHNARGFIELLSWCAIGARSTEDQEHRIFASAVDCAVGMKNPTSGSIKIGVNSVIAAQHEHTTVFDGYQVETAGNDFAHLVLRGGEAGPNFHLDDLYDARDTLKESGVKNPALIIDASHENSRIRGSKDPEFQADVIREVMYNLIKHPELQGSVKGFMLESFIQTGSQKLSACTSENIDRTGLSITDPCLGWESTAQLIRDMAVTHRKLRSLKSA